LQAKIESTNNTPIIIASNPPDYVLGACNYNAGAIGLWLGIIICVYS
jgi:hypothetical protein